jgi:DNA polymerase-3 subunit delta'
MGSNNTQMASSEFEFAEKLNKISGVSQQQTIIEEIDKATYHIERNANPKMLFMALTIKLHHIIHHKTLILAN